VAGNSKFRGIVFCNLDTFKTVISNFVTVANIATPYFPRKYGYPNDVPGGQKMVEEKKNQLHICIIPWYPVS
jgi:hypothetical protein